MACALALSSCAGSVSCHSRLDTAGSIISPTAIKVPSVWKPATRLMTTSIKKPCCHSQPRRPAAPRNTGSKLSSTRPRYIAASSSTLTLATPATIKRPSRSTPSALPNKMCSRSSWVPWLEISVTPSASATR